MRLRHTGPKTSRGRKPSSPSICGMIFKQEGRRPAMPNRSSPCVDVNNVAPKPIVMLTRRLGRGGSSGCQPSCVGGLSIWWRVNSVSLRSRSASSAREATATSACTMCRWRCQQLQMPPIFQVTMTHVPLPPGDKLNNFGELFGVRNLASECDFVAIEVEQPGQMHVVKFVDRPFELDTTALQESDHFLQRLRH